MNINKYIILLLILIITGVILINNLNPVSKNPQNSNFNGNAEAFWFQGQNCNVDFKANQIILRPTNITDIYFDSVKNITIEYSNGENRLINHSGGNGIQIRHYKDPFMLISKIDVNSNIYVNINFGNLTMNKYIEGALLNGSIGYINLMNGGKVDVRSASVDDVDIGNEKIKDFNRITFEIDKDSVISFSPEISQLQTQYIYDLNIESQLSKMRILSQEEGVLNLDSHKFVIKGADSLYIELLPTYTPSQPILVVKDTKIILRGYTNLAKLNDEDVIMNDLQYWFEKQPEKINIIVVVISLLLTVVALISTWKQVSETTKMRKAQTEPEISITIQPSEWWINLIDMVIENIGLGSARNISFEVISDFECEKGKFVSDIGYIKYGLDYFAPKQKLTFFLTSLLENFEEKKTKPLEIKVFYQDKTNKRLDHTFKINFSQFEGLIHTEKPPLFIIAENIKEMKEDIKLFIASKETTNPK